jgi:hypothetical protein
MDTRGTLKKTDLILRLFESFLNMKIFEVAKVLKNKWNDV